MCFHLVIIKLIFKEGVGVDYYVILEEIKNFLYSNSIFVAVIFSALIGKMMENAKSGIFKTWIVFFVGTLFHELAHLIVSLVSFGFPYKVSIFPKKSGNSYMLGSVTSWNVRWYNQFLIGMAPLLLLPLAYFIFLNFFDFYEKSVLNFFIWIYLIVALVFSSIPSSVDFRVAFSGNYIAAIFMAIVGGIFIFYLNYIGVFEWLLTKSINMMDWDLR